MAMDPHPSVELTPLQRARERSVFFMVAADVVSVICFTSAALLSGSLTIIAEMLRGWLVLSAGLFSYLVLRRLHRGNLQELEYGSGKLEQFVNVVIGGAMIPAAVWVTLNALALVAGERPVATPFGLSISAITGAVNCYVNLLSWDGVRRTVGGAPSLLMRGLLTMRLVKLLASLVLAFTLAIAALSADHEIVAWADATGGMFVAVFIFTGAYQILRQALPDLLDRSAGREVRERVEQCLSLHRQLYLGVHRIRSRRAGRTVFVEIALAFAGDLNLAEIEERTNRIRASLESAIMDCDIALLPVATARWSTPHQR